MANVDKIALAYSGGLDTSVMIPWLRETYGCEVVAVVADVGQRDDFEAVRRKALDTGAVACRVVDLKDRFVREQAFPAVRAGAVYEGRYLLGTALARPLIAEAQVRIAHATGCDALAHGCTGKGNDQVRFELAYQTLAPDLAVVAPWREWEIRSREDAIAYAEAHGIPVPVTREKPFSVDQNLWHTSFEGGVLEDPGAPAPDDLRDLTVPLDETPEEPATLEVGFEGGVPASLDSKAVEPVELVRRLNRLAGDHGVGRVDLVENRLVGMKSRGVYETPAGTVLDAALRDLESITLDRDTARFHRTVGERYARLVYEGMWFSPLRQALDAFLASSHRSVTGTVTVELFRGTARPVARRSPTSLYREDLATFDEDGVYRQADAEGFIRLWGLSTRVWAAVHADDVEPDASDAVADASADSASRVRSGTAPASSSAANGGAVPPPSPQGQSRPAAEASEAEEAEESEEAEEAAGAVSAGSPDGS